MARAVQRRDPFQDRQKPATLTDPSDVDLDYDYEQVPDAVREAVRRSAITIKPRLKRAAQDIFVIGSELQAVKDWLQYGTYVDWLDVEFGLSVRMAQRFVNVSQRLDGRSDIMSFLPPTTLYMLAAPSTPDEAIEEVEERVRAGERVRVATVREVIAEAKESVRRSVSIEQVAQDQRMEMTRKLEQAIGRVVALLGEDTVLASDEREQARSVLVQLRSVVRQRMP